MKLLAVMCLVAVSLTGCVTEAFRPQSLGNVSYSDAFTAAKSVLAQYFSIASDDPDSGRIVSRPNVVGDTTTRLLAKTMTRKTATMRIRRGPDGTVVADVRVDVQKQDTTAMQAMQVPVAGDDVGNNTPAQGTASASFDQQQAWQDAGRDAQMENTLIGDLRQRMKK